MEPVFLSDTAERLMAHVAAMAPASTRSGPVERLPFTIRRVATEADMLKAVQVRHAAYARHVPAFAQTLTAPEEADYDSDVVVLLAESKLDGSPLGSTRIQTNLLQALHLEESVELPLWLQTRRLAEVTRLGVGEGRIGHLVKTALIKACFSYCEDKGIDYAVVTGRAPIDRQYEQLLFTDVFASKAFIPLRHVGNLPHRVMAFEIASGEQRWEAAQHPLLGFFRHTQHPDIDITTRHLVQKPAEKAVLSPQTAVSGQSFYKMATVS